MKKNIIMGAAALAMILGLCAYGQKETFANSDSSAEGSGNDISAVVSGDEISAESSSVADETSDVSADNETEGRKKVTVKATGDVLIDSDGYFVEIKDKKTDEFGYSWNIHCENNTGKTVYFGMEYVSVNGVMAIPLFSVEVEAGSAVDNDAVWYMDLQEFGIETPSVIEGTLVVIDSENYSVLASSPFTVCPEGENEAYYELRTEASEDTIIINNDYVNFIATALSQDDYDNVVMDVFIYNKSDKSTILSIDGCFINDAEADPFWAAFLPPDKCVYTKIYWPLSDLQAVGIDSIESINKIRAEISVYDQDTYEVYSNDIVMIDVYSNNSLTLQDF